MKSLNKYMNIVEAKENRRTFTMLGDYGILAIDLQHAEFVMDECKVDRVDVAVHIEDIDATGVKGTDVFDERMN